MKINYLPTSRTFIHIDTQLQKDTDKNVEFEFIDGIYTQRNTEISKITSINSWKMFLEIPSKAVSAAERV